MVKERVTAKLNRDAKYSASLVVASDKVDEIKSFAHRNRSNYYMLIRSVQTSECELYSEIFLVS